MAAPVLIVALGIGGCSSGGDGATPPAPSTATPAASAAPSATPSAGASSAAAGWSAYYDCLGAQGLKLQGSGGVRRVDKDANTSEAIGAAEKACRSLLPGKEPLDPARLAEARKFTACMREKGIADYPDPDPATGDIPVEGGLGARLKSDPKVIAALRECHPTAPAADGGTVEGG
ncbi:hypothetical protein ACFYUJ_02025 [Streptomyces sp. NPDC004520]|uniref:hypothetical protein n=1 Tax=Streptomyces sp. NPDC004520 TaxID=3364702 RepID=UPI003678B3AC